MTEEISTTWRTARKAHTCNYCRRTIQPGERYEHYVGKYDGELYTWRAHEKCVFIAHEIWDYVDPDEGMNDDDFYEDECDESYCMDKLYDFLKKYELYSIREHYSLVWKCRERSMA